MTISLQFAIIFSFVVAPSWFSHALSDLFGVKLHSNLGSFLTKEVPFLFLFFCLIPLAISLFAMSGCFSIDPWTPIAYLVGQRDPRQIVSLGIAAGRWAGFFFTYFVLIGIWCSILCWLLKEKKWYQKILQSIGIWQPFLQELQDEIRSFNRARVRIESKDKKPSEPEVQVERFCEVDISCDAEGATVYSGTLVGISDVGSYQGLLLVHVTIHIAKTIEIEGENSSKSLSLLKFERYSGKNPFDGNNTFPQGGNEQHLGKMFFPKEKIVSLHFRSKRGIQKPQSQSSAENLFLNMDKAKPKKSASKPLSNPDETLLYPNLLESQ